jgi:hypothetical protein
VASASAGALLLGERSREGSWHSLSPGLIHPGAASAEIWPALATNLSPGEPLMCVDVQAKRGVTLVEQTTRTDNVARRDRKAKQRLANKLFLKLDRQGTRYSLCRTAGVSGIVRQDNLSLDEVERELEMWKLRGPHGN